eukprot:scaffold1803_cov261-Pinguiococcus_pyrenoidosus.AAC.1
MAERWRWWTSRYLIAEVARVVPCGAVEPLPTPRLLLEEASQSDRHLGAAKTRTFKRHFWRTSLSTQNRREPGCRLDTEYRKDAPNRGRWEVGWFERNSNQSARFAMARGTLKSLKRTRPSEKVAKVGFHRAFGLTKPKGKASSGTSGVNNSGASANSAANAEELDDLVSWLNCECLVSLLLVGVLAALPFNLQSNDFLNTRENFVTRAEDYYKSGALDKAAALYDRAVSVEETAEGHLYLAETLAHPDLNRLHDAIRHYERAAELYHEDEEERIGIWKSVGKLYTDVDRPDLAVESYQKVLDAYDDADPAEVAEANLQLGLSLLDSHRFHEALEHLTTVTKLKSANELAQLSIADTQRDLGNTEKAVQGYRKVMKHRPRDFTALTGLAFTYHGNGSYEKAMSIYRKALAVNPSAAE